MSEDALDPIRRRMGRLIADYLEAPGGSYRAFDVTPPERLRAALRPADILLVEGNARISTAIKYLTTSTWSHAALFVGDGPGRDLIEADLKAGVHYAALAKYDRFNTRICRAVGLDGARLAAVCDHARGALGRTYDLKNIVDLARYLLPQPPVPKRFRRQMLSLGSGDPTRAICSTLIASAFQSVRYPILPDTRRAEHEGVAAEILRVRHHSLFVPRDFDLSPYFRIVKPTIENGFDFRTLVWEEPDLAAPRPDAPRD